MARISIRAYRLAERRALRRGLALRATSAYFDRRRQRLVVVLANSMELSAPRRLLLPLSGARVADTTLITLSPAGYFLHWPRLGGYLWVTTLLGLRVRQVLLGKDGGGSVFPEAKAAGDQTPTLDLPPFMPQAVCDQRNHGPCACDG